MEKPTILIVGGAWHPAAYLNSLSKVFEEADYPTVTLGLPSVDANPPAIDFSLDIKVIHDKAHRLITENKDIIAVFHSMGGIPGTDALHGLGKKSESAGGVIALIYIASMLPRKGFSFETHLDAIGDESWKPARQIMLKDKMLFLEHDFAKSMFYNDLDEEQADHWAHLLKGQSDGVYDSPLNHETYKEIPSGYLLTTNDQAFPYNYQLKTVEMIGFEQGMTKTMNTGHSPFLTNPKEVKEFIIHIAEGKNR